MGPHQQRLPEFTPPSGLQIWELGNMENGSMLRAILDGVREFFVIDARSEDHLRGIARDIHASRQSSGRSILHWTLLTWNDADAVGLAKDLLALGIHPDPLTDKKRTPTHSCTCWNFSQCAEAIGMCRPDLSAKDKDGSTPIDDAMKLGRSSFWDFIKGGFPTIAQLAHDKKWWAVKNLTRRRVIPDAEKIEKYAGKDAIEWAEHYGEKRIAEELRYLLFPPFIHGRFVELECKVDEDSKKLAAQFDKFKTEFQASQAKLEADIDVLKEGITLRTSRIAEVSTLKEEVDKRLRNNAVSKIELENLEEKLLSKIDAKFEKFQQEFHELKGVLKVRDEMVEAQMKAMQEEFAQLSITATAGSRLPGVLVPQIAPQVSMAMQGGSASHSSELPRGTDLAAANIPMVMDFLALMEKYRR